MNYEQHLDSTASKESSGGPGVWYTGGPMVRKYYAATATGSLEFETQKRLMREWYMLDTKDTCVSECRQKAQCEHWLATGEAHENGVCLSSRTWLYGSLWDHARAWQHVATGERVLTLEPYGNPFDQHDEFVKLKRDMAAVGVSVSFEGRSPYGASYVLFLAVTSTGIGSTMHWYQ